MAVAELAEERGPVDGHPADGVACGCLWDLETPQAGVPDGRVEGEAG